MFNPDAVVSWLRDERRLHDRRTLHPLYLFHRRYKPHDKRASIRILFKRDCGFREASYRRGKRYRLSCILTSSSNITSPAYLAEHHTASSGDISYLGFPTSTFHAK